MKDWLNIFVEDEDDEMVAKIMMTVSHLPRFSTICRFFLLLVLLTMEHDV